MSLWSGALAYLILRAGLAVGVIVLLRRRGVRGWPWLGQWVSDAACVLFVAAYADGAVRSAVGWLVAPLLAYVAVWEAAAILRGASDDAATANETESPATAIAAVWRWSWAVLCVAPPLAAGGFLVFDLVAPQQWPFPDRLGGPRFVCASDTVGPSDALTLRMDRPHGDVLGVSTPGGRFLYIALPATPAEARQFRGERSLTLRVGQVAGAPAPGKPREPVFIQPGEYTFRLTEAAEFEAARVCRVSYAP